MRPGGLHLLANIGGTGYHDGGWREPGVGPDAFLDIAHYRQIAETCERGLLDAILFPDIPALSNGGSRRPPQALEPTLLVAALAMSTSHVGFLPTLSTSYNHPYNLARRVLSLDHTSDGRAGWNLVTTAVPAAAANFGLSDAPQTVDRYRRATEFTELSFRLWDSWEDDALLGDQAAGQFADPDRIHASDHHGEFFRVAGPMNVPRSPQGRPVTAMAGASDAGMRFAAGLADVVYGSQLSLSGALAFAARVRELAAGAGRDPEELRFLPGLVVVVEETESAAQARWSALQAQAADGASEREQLEAIMWVAPGSLGADLDAPVDPAVFHHRHQGFTRAFTRFAEETGYSPRQFANHVHGGHRLVVGDTVQVADHIEAWWRSGAVDGFTLAPPATPYDLERFVDLVVPELQRRGIYRQGYPGTTLRQNLGLDVPENSFTAPLGPRAEHPDQERTT